MGTPGPDPDGQPGPQSGQSAPPTCYRHPGRETYVSCVRCGRPACPDCLRSAAVGQQCLDCIKASHAGSRTASGLFGGRNAASATVTWALVGINILLYLVELARPNLANDLGMVGLVTFTGHLPLVGVATGQWYRLITSAFLPPPGGGLGPLDIIFNLWALIVVGPALEKILGHTRFIAVYLVSAVGGSVLFYYLAQPNAQALGASGAIFGLLGAWFVVAKRLGLDNRWLISVVVINFFLDLLLRSEIAWQAHVGGLLAGGLLTAAFAYAPRQRRAYLQAGATIVLVGLMALAVALRTSQLHY
jgi:membrane associated rhomboid family serine protease